MPAATGPALSFGFITANLPASMWFAHCLLHETVDIKTRLEFKFLTKALDNTHTRMTVR